ncbi:MAG: type IX secretion system membrane protein PorP/SprF [Bacteroidetes bacterium]|nr:MAG: type IX secretion system membrane protein PorP/SprF [Bacteroidota bacterium]
MKRFRPVVFAIFAIFCSMNVNAQDIHFSQFYLSPLNLNPAMTGVMNCNARLVANYRNQWASVLKSNAYNTYSASYDQRIPVGRYDFFGVGGTFWGDKAGEAEFATMTGKLSASYSKRMGGGRKEAHYLVFGVEGGIAQRSLDFLKLRWGSQHDGAGGFDETIASGEDNLNNDNFIFADLAAGLLWFSVFDENNNFYIGGAFHHLNRANQSFYDNTEDFIYSRFTLHAGGEFEISRKVGLVPGVIAMFQGPSFQVNSGTSLKFNLGGRGSQQAFHIGTWVRLSNQIESGILTDAVILQTRFDYSQFSLGFSYDVNVSPLKPASNNNGAFEFALVYKFCGDTHRGVYCPNW